ncbi:unnamed protein product [Periconia digitata]|uniref:Uncharacterized protein n=1 Tax=Periconia digitata TaxID=1303443 RepID=A0A9W4UBV7_9PLEO|nr:unnamed protein product [Periconia digitata]
MDRKKGSITRTTTSYNAPHFLVPLPNFTSTCTMNLMSIPPELRLYIARRYSLIDPRYSEKDYLQYNTNSLIWDRTKKAIDSPKIVQYVERINLPSTRVLVWDADGDSDREDEISASSPQVLPEELVDLYLNQARQHPILEQLVRDFRHGQQDTFGTDWRFEQSVRVGSDAPIVTILLSMTCNLKTLCFTEIGGLEDEFADFIKRVSLAYRDPKQVQFLPFQTLSRVSVSHEFPDYCCAAEWAIWFLRIPTLQKFASWGMGDGIDDSYAAEDTNPEYSELVTHGLQDYHISNVKQLWFKQSLFAPAAIDQIIRTTKTLQAFTYFGDCLISEIGFFLPRRIVAALVEHAGHSLEDLLLWAKPEHPDFEHDQDFDHASLYGFEKLKRLRCRWSILKGELDVNDHEEPLSEAGHGSESKSERTDLVNFSARSSDTVVDVGDDKSLSGENLGIGSYKDFVDLAKVLPQSLEELQLDTDPGDKGLIASFMALVAGKETNFPNLKQVYFQPHADESDAEMQELIQALREKSIVFGILDNDLWYMDHEEFLTLEYYG